MTETSAPPSSTPPSSTPPGGEAERSGGAQGPAQLLAAAVAACPGVESLSGGRFGEVATYLPGRRVTGVRLTDAAAEVHVVARWGVAVPALADQVRAACRPLVEGRRVDVFVDDVALPEPPAPEQPTLEPAAPGPATPPG